MIDELNEVIGKANCDLPAQSQNGTKSGCTVQPNGLIPGSCYPVKALPLTVISDDPHAGRGWRQRLLDVYGPLLTEHQNEACRLHLDEDWSYAEIAERFGCSRSAAHDLVRRATSQLDHFEERLGHAAELRRRDAVEDELRAQVRRLRGGR